MLRSRKTATLVRRFIHSSQIRLHKKSIEDDLHFAKRPLWKKILSGFMGKNQPGTLILVRHGETEWNKQKKFTGWVDVDLSATGIREIEHAARLLLERGHTVDIAYTSMLKRAIRSCWILLRELNQIYRPVIKSWRLNERMYGGLEGLSKPELAYVLGADQVQGWRAGLHERPPAMDPGHKHCHVGERKYQHIDKSLIPTTESLQDTLDRTIPLWNSQILPDLQAGRNVMIVAHANSLRGIVKHIDNLSVSEIQKVGIPNGIPLVYKFDRDMKPIPQAKAVAPLTGEFLEKKGLLKAALLREEEYAEQIDGYKESQEEMATLLQSRPYYNPTSPELLKSLSKLEQHRQLFDIMLRNQQHNSSSSSSSGTAASTYTEDSTAAGVSAASSTGKASNTMPIQASRNVSASAASALQAMNGVDFQSLDSPLLVIIRHGKTEHNQLGLFTGWEDAALADEGRQEAIHAGRLLQKHKISFDIVYTSWLSRAIETAWMVMNELDDSLWLPIVKTWRLNERMYGALTGLSKKMIKQRHGPEQFLKWRRGYDTPPPDISSFSHAYPGNDERYVKYVEDIPISFFETFIRSLAHGKLDIHLQFPKAESLKDCMDRTIPFFKDVIVPKSLNGGKNVLIASSENAIRGLLMHLCKIPIDRIHSVEIPTGLPMVFDWRTNRIRLLEDPDLKVNPFTQYNFGSSPDLLFKPDFMSLEQFQAILSAPVPSANVSGGVALDGKDTPSSVDVSRSIEEGDPTWVATTVDRSQGGDNHGRGGGGNPTSHQPYDPILRLNIKKMD